MIEVYGQPMCRGCTEVKNFLNNNGFDYKYVDVETSPEGRQKLMDKGIMKLPAIFIEGEEFIGFTPEVREKLEELI